MKQLRSIVLGFASLLLLTAVGCHSGNGLGLNEKASVRNLGDLPENPLLLNAITTRIYPRDSMMAVLYGNMIAYNYARSYGNASYPAGAVLYEVTWKVIPDEQWFGANVPEIIKAIERVEFLENTTPKYTLYEGNAFKQSIIADKASRVDFIVNQRMAVSP